MSTQPEQDHSTDVAVRERFDARSVHAHVDSIFPINLDANVAATTVMGVVPRLRDLREAVAAMPGMQMDLYDKVGIYAEALAQAQANFLIASTPAEPLPALVARAVELRDELRADATALSRHKLIDGNAIAELKGGTGYPAAGTDLGARASILRANWSVIQGKCAITAEQLDEAQHLFEDIMHAYGSRSQTAERVATATDDRARASTLLVSAYDHARRAVTYLRWDEGDADKIAPSLWSGRNGRGGAPAKPADPPADGTSTPVAPAPADGGPMLVRADTQVAVLFMQGLATPQLRPGSLLPHWFPQSAFDTTGSSVTDKQAQSHGSSQSLQSASVAHGEVLGGANAHLLSCLVVEVDICSRFEEQPSTSTSTREKNFTITPQRRG